MINKARAPRPDGALAVSVQASQSFSYALLKQFVERRTHPLSRFLINGSNKIVVQFAGNRVKPSPVFGYRLKDNGAAVPANLDFRPRK